MFASPRGGGGQRRLDGVDALAEVLERVGVERHFPERVDREHAGREVVLHVCASDVAVSADVCLRDGARLEAEVCGAGMRESVGAKVVCAVDDGADRRSHELGRGGEADVFEGLLRERGAVLGAQRAGEVRHHGLAGVFRGAGVEEAREESDLVRGLLELRVPLANGDFGVRVLRCPVLVMCNVDRHGMPPGLRG